ncbi:hypothetical protein MAR_021006 [Mya arenaria]|uniref:RING-type domain-containing protein n=1 Tax=Mya arenaria TaxID=6604 RepID=A0ABY7EA05_MYAAR|nr:hypothetical protein MAR_021006 [Mya arenaria]
MECITCRVKKPINEFPSQTVFNACQHPAFSCLRCIVKSVEDESKCPECPLQVLKNDERVAFFKSQLHYLFKEYSVNSDDGTIVDAIDQDQAIVKSQEYHLYIVLITGKKHKISCDKESTVLSLKSKIKAVTKKNESLQRLFFRNEEMLVKALNNYKNITLSVYEQSSPDMNLCELRLDEVKDWQAVIVCRATRNPKSGSWQVCEMQVPSNGTALEAYGELIKTLSGLLPELKTVK